MKKKNSQIIWTYHVSDDWDSSKDILLAKKQILTSTIIFGGGS